MSPVTVSGWQTKFETLDRYRKHAEMCVYDSNKYSVTHSFVSLTLEYNFLVMLHSFLHMNLQDLLLLDYLASFTA